MESFFDIEERKKKVIFFFFTFLLIIYFLTFYFILTILNFTFFENFRLLSYQETFFIFLVSFLTAYFHWKISTKEIVNKILNILKATKIDEDDSYHRLFKNVAEEISIACGGVKLELVVVPAYSLNAFSLSDFKGRNIIGITEGLLANLNRNQLQAVVAHEVAHIINGDSFLTTISSSLFDIYNFMLEKLSEFGRGNRRIPFQFFLILILLSSVRFLSRIINFFISRQREYRADATAVRLTRSPQSLAEALYIISRHSNSIGIGIDNLENIFIINPKNRRIDEKEGIIANLFSTHPPIKKRIDILLNISHNNFLNMIKELEENKKISQSVFQISPEKKYFVSDPDGKWIGPLSKEELCSLNFINPSTFIYNSEFKKGIYKISEDRELNSYISGKGKKECPSCRGNLSEKYYEGTNILSCPYCGGCFVENEKVIRILSRKNIKFPEEIEKKGKIILESMNKFFNKSKDIETPFKLLCPNCSEKMKRMFYNYVYPLEIDRCLSCGGIWFDKDELEILQYLFEKNQKC
jgi:heat shock protein HtpX